MAIGRSNPPSVPGARSRGVVGRTSRYSHPGLVVVVCRVGLPLVIAQLGRAGDLGRVLGRKDRPAQTAPQADDRWGSPLPTLPRGSRLPTARPHKAGTFRCPGGSHPARPLPEGGGRSVLRSLSSSPHQALVSRTPSSLLRCLRRESSAPCRHCIPWAATVAGRRPFPRSGRSARCAAEKRPDPGQPGVQTALATARRPPRDRLRACAW